MERKEKKGLLWGVCWKGTSKGKRAREGKGGRGWA